MWGGVSQVLLQSLLAAEVLVANIAINDHLDTNVANTALFNLYKGPRSNDTHISR